jgi:hypothetical protein
MNTYAINTESKHKYVLYKNNAIIGSLTFINWNLSKFKMELNGCNYEIKYGSLWSSDGTIYKDNISHCDFNKKWTGKRVFEMLDNYNTKYLAQNKGFFKRHYDLLNANNEEIYIVTKNYIWSKWQYQFNINLLKPTDLNHENEFLILVHLYFIMVDLRRRRNASA